MRGGGFGHELITRSPHCFGIAARIHPVRVLHLTGIMEQVAEIVETLARGADTDDRMARRLIDGQTGQMPPIATNVRDQAAIELMKQWIAGLEKK